MASEQCWPCCVLRTDGGCFKVDGLPTFLAGLYLAWTSIYMGSLFSWEKLRVTHQPSSNGRIAVLPSTCPTPAASCTSSPWMWPRDPGGGWHVCVHPHGGCGHLESRKGLTAACCKPAAPAATAPDRPLEATWQGAGDRGATAARRAASPAPASIALPSPFPCRRMQMLLPAFPSPSGSPAPLCSLAAGPLGQNPVSPRHSWKPSGSKQGREDICPMVCGLGVSQRL